MKRMSFRIAAALIILAALPAAAKTPTLSTDLGSTATAALLGGGLSLNAQVEIPLAPSWTLELLPVFSLASTTGLLTTQTSVEAAARFWFSGFFAGYPEGRLDTGLFVELGVIAAFAYMNGGSPLSLLSAGPAARTGWRFAFGDSGFFLEPYAGWMALFGVSLGGGAGAINQGLICGLAAGWRF
jgi:hypothetical protein